MNSLVYHINSPVLKPWVQYILFNNCTDPCYKGMVRSFANTNYCLGITRDRQMITDEQGNVTLISKQGVHSYLSGIYIKPFNFIGNGLQDEICIDFTPLGYYHFFRFPARTFLFQTDLLTEAFGRGAIGFFEQLFSESDFNKRGVAIESFLLKYYRKDEDSFLSECIYQAHRSDQKLTMNLLAQILRCSERKLHRYFTQYFDITPLDYLRVVKFRQALKSVKQGDDLLTKISYTCEYYDQSHMIREFHLFTGFSPQNLRSSLRDVDGQVLFLTD